MEKGSNFTVNYVVIIGKIINELSLKKLQNGHRVLSVILQTKRWAKKDGQPVILSDTAKVVCWDRVADFVQAHGKRGDLLYTSGHLETRYVIEDHKELIIMEVIASEAFPIKVTEEMQKDKMKEAETRTVRNVA